MGTEAIVPEVGGGGVGCVEWVLPEWSGAGEYGRANTEGRIRKGQYGDSDSMKLNQNDDSWGGADEGQYGDSDSMKLNQNDDAWVATLGGGADEGHYGDSDSMKLNQNDDAWGWGRTRANTEILIR
jgi:hypothetical protein